MRILYVITRAVEGGAQTHVRDLAEGFAAAYEVGVVLFDDGPLAARLRASGIRVWALDAPTRSMRLWRDLLAGARLTAIIRSFRPTLVHAHSSKAGLIARAAAMLARVPAIYTAHGWAFIEASEHWHHRFFARGVERAAALITRRIICVSQFDRDLAARRRIASPNRIVVIPNGIGSIETSVTRALHDGVRCITIARFSPPKDPLTLIEAAARISSECELLLVGEGELLDVARARTRNFGVGDRVRFLGARSDVPALLADSDLFVLSTRWEGMPYTILEAMRAGLPVVATAVGGIPEAVIDGETGFLVPPGDAAALAERIEQLANSPELRARMGDAARNRWLQHFHLAGMLQAVGEVYAEVASAGATTGPHVSPLRR